MGCSSCANNKTGTPDGCGSKGHCQTGGCNKLNTYDWINTLDLDDPSEYNVVEVSFKKGARKGFYLKNPSVRVITGDIVVVESDSGYDVGQISLSGELVRLQIKKKKFPEDRIIHKIIRKANHRDVEKLEEARALEHKTLVKSRVIARTLGLNMKIGDIEYQGDKRKATFYYTAEGRVDFRELVRSYAKEFRVKIEMRQIGSRQESARIGGVGACGRELCCSTWLSNFTSVTTSAARYQNIAINQTKLSGQCGRLKCCLNYELDMYLEALDEFPKNLEYLELQQGRAYHVKTDIFKGQMYFALPGENNQRGPIVAISKERVWEVKSMNKKGEKPLVLKSEESFAEDDKKEMQDSMEFADVTGQIELPPEKRKKRRGRRRPNNRNRNSNNRGGSKNRNSSSNNGSAKNKSGSQNNRNRNSNNSNKK